jgi:hypothetical protein
MTKQANKKDIIPDSSIASEKMYEEYINMNMNDISNDGVLCMSIYFNNRNQVFHNRRRRL